MKEGRIGSLLLIFYKLKYGNLNKEDMEGPLLAKNYLARSSARVLDAKNALRSGARSYSLKYCKDAIELIIKACLTFKAIPCEGKLEDIIEENKEALPEQLREVVDKALSLLKNLREEQITEQINEVDELGKRAAIVIHASEREHV